LHHALGALPVPKTTHEFFWRGHFINSFVIRFVFAIKTVWSDIYLFQTTAQHHCMFAGICCIQQFDLKWGFSYIQIFLYTEPLPLTPHPSHNTGIKTSI
jgi:hypothetical protein